MAATAICPSPPVGRGKDDYLVSLEQLDQLDNYLAPGTGRGGGAAVPGNIDADPYWHDKERNACRYCDYAAAAISRRDAATRSAARKALSAGEFWELLKEKGGEGHGH